MNVLKSIRRNRILFTLLFLLTTTAALIFATDQTARAQTDVNFYSGGGGGGGGGQGGDGGDHLWGGSANNGADGSGGDGGSGGDASTLYSGGVPSATTGGDGGGNIGSGGLIDSPGADASLQTFSLNPDDTIADLNIQSGDGGNGGSGGEGGQGGDGDFFWGTGSQGDDGGNGGAGGSGGDIQVIGSNLGTYNVTGNIHIIAGNGGHGGDGGNEGADAAVSPSDGPGDGGDGGQGGNGGDITVSINAAILSVDNDFNLTGGDSGSDGSDGSGGIYGGSGGVGGGGGNVDVTIDAEKLIIGNDLNIQGGNGSSTASTGGGAKLTANDVELNGNLSLVSGTYGGDAELDMSNGRLLVTDGSLNHNFSFTGANDAKLTVTIDKLEIAANNTVDMTITNNIVGTDKIDFGMLILQKGSAFATSNSVGADYVVTRGLRVHTAAQWATAGIWNADYQNNGITMMYDMTEVKTADQTMLYLTENGGIGVIELADFNPVAQHNDSNSDPFITSANELKNLHLGTTVLADSTQNGQLWANQHTADYFGYNAGLRRYYFEVDGSGSTLLARNFATADGYGTYLQGHLAGLANTIQTFWYTSSPLINDASRGELDKFTVSLRAGASRIKHKTGSYAEIDNVSVAASASYKFATAIGHTTAGLIAEYGHGKYNVSSNIWGLSSFFGKYNLKGAGDTDQLGLGIFARNNFLQGSYIEASLRGGRISTDFKTKNWASSNRHRWDNDTNYWSAHLGIGHETKITATTLMDIYAKALWSNTVSNSFTSDFDERVKLDSINSLRSRVGARVTQDLVENQLKAYVGGAWEYEFDAKAKGRIGNSVIGYDAISDSPDLKGSSFMGELGLSFEPAETKISFDAGLFGLAGKQDGYGGYAGVKFSF